MGELPGFHVKNGLVAFLGPEQSEGALVSDDVLEIEKLWLHDHFPSQAKRLHIPGSLAGRDGFHYGINKVLFADRYQAFLESRTEKNNVGEKFASKVQLGDLANSSTEVLVRV